MADQLIFSLFEEKDFPEYRSWYEDAELDKRLGPMNEDWLKHIRHEADGCQYSVFRDDELVAVVGIKYPTEQYTYYCITDLAIKPSLRGQGIGSEVLKGLMSHPDLQEQKMWRSYVDERNPKAKAFLQKNGWICIGDSPDEHGMWIFSIVREEDHTVR